MNDGKSEVLESQVPDDKADAGQQVKELPMDEQGLSTVDESDALLGGRRLKLLGKGAQYAEDLHLLLARTALFSGLGRTESRLLGAMMHVYQAMPGQTLITEGDTGNYMMLVMTGQVEVIRRDAHDFPVHISMAMPGQTLGEMSMVDGMRRFASCVAMDDCRVAVLTRTGLLALLRREPALGNKILLKLVSLLSDRLRETSEQLVNCLTVGRRQLDERVNAAQCCPGR